MPQSQYEVEPFQMPGEDHPPTSPTTETGTGRQVYVVHHDGGRAPVTVYHEDGTEVVELPPRYAGSSSGGTTSDRDGSGAGTRFDRSLSDGEGGGGGEFGARTPDFLQQRRESGPAPKKASALRPLRRES